MPDDIGRIIEMGQRFVRETTYGEFIELSMERLSMTVVGVASNPKGVILLSEDGPDVTGMIALVVQEHPYSGIPMAFELVWWVDPERRGIGRELLSAAEGWAREQGARAIQMVAPNPRVGALYERLGYRAVETSYQRSL
jgi:GNAT superfamily N-acetyltransferase